MLMMGVYTFSFKGSCQDKHGLNEIMLCTGALGCRLDGTGGVGVGGGGGGLQRCDFPTMYNIGY